MNFRKMRQKAFIDEEPVEVNNGITAGEMLRSQGLDDLNRSLVQTNPNGSHKVLKSTDRIELKEGNRFESKVNGTGGY